MGQQRVPFKEGGTPLPFQIRRPLAQDCARGQLLQINSAGNAVRCDGVTPNLKAFGPADRDQLAGTDPTDAAMAAWQNFVSQYLPSTIANDGPTDTSIAQVVWGVDTKTVGLLSNYNGDNRSMIGLVYGFDGDNVPTPLIWSGLVAWCVARGVHIADHKSRAWYSIADASASTATTERVIPGESLHGQITAITFTGAAVAADPTDYATITIAKRGSADAYASATTIGTYDTRATPTGQGAITAFTPASFSLSVVAGALNVLEDDIITITVTKAASGKTLTGAFNVQMKVQ